MLPDAVFDPINFLVAARFSEQPSALYYEDHLGWSLEERQRVLNEIELYRKYLKSLPPRQLQDLVHEEIERRAAAEDAKQPFNEALSSDDVQHWCGLACWSLPEAVTLTLGKDPCKAEGETLAAAVKLSPLAKKYVRLKDRVVRAEQAGELSDPISPARFIEWAQREAISVPKDLMEAVTRRCGKIEDDKSIRETNERLIRRVGELEAILASQHQEGTGEGNRRSDRPLLTRERDSLYSILIACAIIPYNYRPGIRSDVPTRISQQLERWGLPLSDDTVRNHLTKASEMLPGDWQKRSAYQKKR